MDINRENFAAEYPVFLHLLETCRFVSFDEEMTGIFGQGEGSQKRDDTVEQRYQKMISVATKYGIIQFGICLFHESADGDALVATPYNFYIFPNSRDDLVVSPSAIEFLRKNKMDFNQWLSNGVTYLPAEGEQWARNKFFPEAATSGSADGDAIPVVKELIKLTRQSDIDFIERNMALVDAMLASNECNEDGTGAGDVVALESTNAFLRRVLYEQLEHRYPGKVNVVKNDQNILSALKVDPSKQAAFELKQKIEKERQFHEMIGFRRVFNALIACKKPLVGHNLFFDLLFMMRWLDGPLAADFDSFRTDLHEKFPYIYDTKHLSDLNIDGSGLSDTSLEKCYLHYVKNRPYLTEPIIVAPSPENETDKAPTGLVKHLVQKIESGISGSASYSSGSMEVIPEHVPRTSGVELRMSEVVKGYSVDSAQYHNAGYDAFVTGCVFARQVEVLQAKSGAEGKSLVFVLVWVSAFFSPAFIALSFLILLCFC